jgi:hypothetical protein
MTNQSLFTTDLPPSNGPLTRKSLPITRCQYNIPKWSLLTCGGRLGRQTFSPAMHWNVGLWSMSSDEGWTVYRPCNLWCVASLGTIVMAEFCGGIVEKPVTKKKRSRVLWARIRPFPFLASAQPVPILDLIPPNKNWNADESFGPGRVGWVGGSTTCFRQKLFGNYNGL